MILTEQEVKDRYRVIRGYTASIAGTDVVLCVEDATKELVQSHLEALKDIEELKELIINAEKSIKEVIRHFKGE
jgi:hypothetical protein